MKRELYGIGVVAMVKYVAETWGIRMKERHKSGVMEIMCLRSEWRNEEVRCRNGVREKMSDSPYRKVLKWFVHVERMS